MIDHSIVIVSTIAWNNCKTFVYADILTAFVTAFEGRHDVAIVFPGPATGAASFGRNHKGSCLVGCVAYGTGCILVMAIGNDCVIIFHPVDGAAALHSWYVR